MRKTHLNKSLIGAFALVFVLSSCVDDSYDLNKDIDLTITVGGDEFAIPGGNTSKWMLGDILELEEDGTVKLLDNGDYALVQDGNPTDPSTVRIEDVQVTREEDIKPILIDDLSFVLSARSSQKASNERYEATIPPGKQTTFKFHKSEMPEDILSIERAEINMSVKLDFDALGLNRVATKAYFRQLVLTFPEYFVFGQLGDMAGKGSWTIQDRQMIGTDVPITSNGLEIPVPVNELVYGDYTGGDEFVFNREQRTLDLKGIVTVGGEMYVNQSDLVTSSPTPDWFDVRADVTMDDIDILTVTGKVDPKIEIKDQFIELGDMPDFLQDDEVILDVYNPQINLQVYNEATVPVKVDAILTSIKNGEEIARVNVDNIPVAAGLGENNGITTQICLSGLGTGAPAGYMNMQVEDLGNLIRTIPDEIKMQIQSEVADKYTQVYKIKLGQDFEVNTDYKVDASLAFGKDLRIIYKDSVDGWHSDMEDYDIKRMVLKGKAYNGIPLDVHLEADARDEYGNVINGIKVKVKEVIAAAVDDVATLTDLNIEIIQEVEGAMKNLDGLLFRAKATSNAEVEGKVLNKEQYLQLQELKLTVPGGATINLN